MTKFRITFTVLEQVTIEASSRIEAEDKANELRKKSKSDVIKTTIRPIKETPKSLPDTRTYHSKQRKLGHN
jgi:hypothetical protein